MTKEKAQAILDYLLEKKKGFVFLQSTGGIISVEDCLEVLAEGRTLSAEELLLV